jgi:hypothetical protein
LTFPKRIDPRRIKGNRAYTIEELARLLCCHKNSVRLWMKQGLSPLEDGKRPLLIQGAAARTFLAARRVAAKRKCQANEMFCFKCKVPRHPALGTVQYRPASETCGMVSAMCGECATAVFKCTSWATAEAAWPLLIAERSECSRTLKQAA